MRFLRTNTAARVTVGPFFDKTDGVTPETALTVTACKLTLMVDDANVPTIVLDVAPTASGGANDMVHVTGDDAGFYDLELAAANVNYLGRAMLAITDAATHCPVFHEFMILPAMVYDSMILGTDTLNADVTQFGGTNLTAASGIPEVKVASIAASAITAAAIATDAIDADAIAANAIDAGAIAADAITAAKLAADVTTEIQSGLATATALTTVDDFLDTEIAAIKAKTDLIPAAPAAVGDIPTAATIADAVWDEDATAHQTQGTFGQAIGDPVADADTIWGLVNTNLNATVSSRASQTSVDTIDDFLDTEVTAILADTNELQTDWANGGRLDLLLDGAASAGDPWTTALPGAYGAGTAGKIVGDNINATISSRASQTSVDDLPTNAELATALGTADDAVLAAIAALNNLSQANIRTALGMATANFDTQIGDLPTNAELATALGTADDAVLAAIAALNNLSQANVRTAVGLASANLDTQLAATATAAALATVAGYVDTEVAAIKAKTDNLPTDPADASDIAASFVSIASTLSTLASYVDTEVAAIKAKTDSLTFTVAGSVDANIQRVNDVAVVGTGAPGDEWGA